MLTAVFRAVVDRFKLQGQRLGDAAAGAVIKHPKDYNLTRESVAVLASIRRLRESTCSAPVAPASRPRS